MTDKESLACPSKVLRVRVQEGTVHVHCSIQGTVSHYLTLSWHASFDPFNVLLIRVIYIRVQVVRADRCDLERMIDKKVLDVPRCVHTAMIDGILVQRVVVTLKHFPPFVCRLHSQQTWCVVPATTSFCCVLRRSSHSPQTFLFSRLSKVTLHNYNKVQALRFR